MLENDSSLTQQDPDSQSGKRVSSAPLASKLNPEEHPGLQGRQFQTKMNPTNPSHSEP